MEPLCARPLANARGSESDARSSTNMSHTAWKAAVSPLRAWFDAAPEKPKITGAWAQ